MSEPTPISWLPSWVHTAELARFDWTSESNGARWRCIRPNVDGWGALEQGLHKACDVLREMPIAQIVTAIDRVAARWQDRSWSRRVAARDSVVAATGFSPEAVDRSFDVELRNYRADSLWRTLRRELGDPEVLDRFTPNAELPGVTRAIGPRITLVVLTGNVPGLPALSMVRALLVKSAVVAKVASGEPSFAAAFAASLYEEDPRLGEAIVITYWDRADTSTRDAAIAISDAVIVFGSQEACSTIRAAVPLDRVVVEHGHKLSLGVIARAYRSAVGDAELAQRIALDVATFNQQACIAPQLYFVESEVDEARPLVRALADALEAYARECPLGSLSDADACALQLRRASRAWAAAADASCDFATAVGLDWTVTLGEELPNEGGGNRFIHVVPVATLERALEAIRPFGRVLQNVGIGARGAELRALSEAFARMGASRVCEPGRMAEPSMMWRHDGMPCVAALVRWCDVEMHGALDSWLQRGGDRDEC